MEERKGGKGSNSKKNAMQQNREFRSSRSSTLSLRSKVGATLLEQCVKDNVIQLPEKEILPIVGDHPYN